MSHWFSPQYNHTTAGLCISYSSAAVIEYPDDSEKKRCLVFMFQSRGIVHYGQEDINRRMRPGRQSRSRPPAHRKQRERTGSGTRICKLKGYQSRKLPPAPSPQRFYRLPKQYHQPGTQCSNIGRQNFNFKLQFATSPLHDNSMQD